MKDISMYDQTYAPLKDAPKSPTITLEDGTAIHLSRQDPYGHIFLKLDTGELPEKYKGAYTTMPMAEHAVKMYAEDRRKATEDLIKEGKLKKQNGTTKSNSSREQVH